MRIRFLLPVFSLVIGTTASCAAEPVTSNVEFRLPPGFSAKVLIAGVPNARSLTWGPQGLLFVGTRKAGKLYAVRDPLSADPSVVTVAEKLKLPNGVAFRDGSLYVAESKRLLRFPDIAARLENPGAPEVLGDPLPYKSGLHAWKYLAFGPDGRLYLPIGAPCNVCDESGFGQIISMRADGSDRRVEAMGVRNSVGFDWHPETGELWFTDNGRDMLGDDIPAGELNRVAERGQHFGFPYCHGGDLPDPEFSDLGSCSDAVAPAQQLGPHVAPLGMLFYSGDMFPAEYRGQIILAEHGSWNRSKAAGPTGYRLSLVRLDGNEAIAYEPFMEGFLGPADEVRGRPVDVLEAPDGSLLVSDDKAGVIYQITYAQPAKN